MAPHQIQPDSPPRDEMPTTTTTTTTKPPTTTGTVTKEESQSYYASLPASNVAPLWTVMGAMVPPLPNPKASITKWDFQADIRPLLLRAGQIVDAESAERRVLMLVNPSMRAPYTTDTIYAGLQLILPGETAPAHRHTAFALRFIIEGNRGFTAVEGKKVEMRKGDVILTPSWDWHDHGHEGEGPMIWLDGLDLPLYQNFPTNFAEMYQSSRYPSEPIPPSSAPNLIIPWSTAQSHLDSSSSSSGTTNHSIYHYTIPSSSSSPGSEQQQPLSKTISAQAEKILPGTETTAIRETCSFVYHCFRGKGETILRLAGGGKEEVVSWRKGDTFAVPAWTERVHRAFTLEEGEDEKENGEDGASYLFAINDLPLLRNLGMYRREGGELEKEGN